MFKYLFNNRFSNKIRSDLSKMPKTYWFGGMALGITIHLLMSVLWDPSEYSHLLTPHSRSYIYLFAGNAYRPDNHISHSFI